MTTISIETLIYCYDCSEDLTVEVGKVAVADKVGEVVPCIRVSPCKRCMEATKEEAQEEE